MGVRSQVSDSIRANRDEMVASPYLIAISILSILSSHMYDSYGCIEDFFKALTCLWVHNIWRIHVYAPKSHLTFSGYDESLMMTSIGFHIFGPQINKVVRGVGQQLCRSVCQCVSVCLCTCVFERAFKQSRPASDRKMLVLIGGRVWPSLGAMLWDWQNCGWFSKFFSEQSLPARLWEFHPLLIRSKDESRNAQWGLSIFGPTQQKKNTASTANSVWKETRKYLFFF